MLYKIIVIVEIAQTVFECFSFGDKRTAPRNPKNPTSPDNPLIRKDYDWSGPSAPRFRPGAAKPPETTECPPVGRVAGTTPPPS